MKIAFQCLAVVIGLTAFLPLIRSDAWWIRGFEFPRMQMLTAGLFAGSGLWILGVETWLIDGGILGFLMLSIGFQAWWIWPYSKLARHQVLTGNGDRRLSIFISNVLMSNRKADRLLELIRSQAPDIILAVETDHWWVEALRKLDSDYPHVVEVPQDDTYGMVIRSRLPLVNPSVTRLVKESIPSIHTGVQLDGDDIINFYAVHPKPPFPAEDTSTTDRDGELLIVGKQVEEHRGPTIVAGDLNDVAWSETTRLFQKISGLLDPRVGRGRFSTYHADHWWLRWPLDHIFLSAHFRLRRIELQPSIGSDHFPILVELSFEPYRQEEQSGLDKDPHDERNAKDKISKATE